MAANPETGCCARDRGHRSGLLLSARKDRAPHGSGIRAHRLLPLHLSTHGAPGMAALRSASAYHMACPCIGIYLACALDHLHLHPRRMVRLVSISIPES